VPSAMMGQQASAYASPMSGDPTSASMTAPVNGTQKTRLPPRIFRSVVSASRVPLAGTLGGFNASATPYPGGILQGRGPLPVPEAHVIASTSPTAFLGSSSIAMAPASPQRPVQVFTHSRARTHD